MIFKIIYFFNVIRCIIKKFNVDKYRILPYNKAL